MRILIANDPGEQVGECARRVVASITFMDEADKPLIDTKTGRWAETRQRAQTGHIGLTFDESVIDIDANGLEHPLDVAMKVPGDASFYAYNYDNSQAPDLRLASHELDVSTCRVRVTIRGDNTTRISKPFILYNEGVSGALRLE